MMFQKYINGKQHICFDIDELFMWQDKLDFIEDQDHPAWKLFDEFLWESECKLEFADSFSNVGEHQGLENEKFGQLYTYGVEVLKKYQPACIFCGNARDVSGYKGKNVCANCRRELGDSV